jgi:acetylglutamate kinase
MSPNPIIIKIGGSLIQERDELTPFWEALQELQERAPIVLVHGGGAQATAMARRLEHEPRIVEGRRVTSDLDLDIVLWTMCSQLNTQLVAAATSFDLSPVGLSGADTCMVQVTRRPPWTIDGETIDFGWVGDVTNVHTELLDHLLAADFFPIVAPLGIDTDGQLYNVNADTVACSIARALNASEFLLITDAGGVQRDLTDPTSRLDRCTRETFEKGKKEGWIKGGMQVKLHTAYEALEGGVSHVQILAPADVAAREHGTVVV